MANLWDGILLVDKEEGETSFSVVKKIRKVLGVRKVGHAGTLDPFATGLLVVLLGEGTKLSPFLMAGEKHYKATLRLGIETDTMDPTGAMVKTSPVPGLEIDFIKECALGFTGEIEQEPPIFSAIRYEGRRAYDLARKGIKVDLAKRKVRIYHLEIESVDLPDVTMVIACSGGTYVRSLAADLGRKLGPGAHLRALRRLSSGSLSVEDALRSRDLESGIPKARLRERLISLKEALPQMEETWVDDSMAFKIRHGYQPKQEEVREIVNAPSLHENHVKVVRGNELVAIMKITRASGTGAKHLSILRVFHPFNP